MKKYKYVGTEEQLVEHGFVLNDFGNYEKSWGQSSITILEYDNAKHIRCDVYIEELGFTSCNSSHNRIVKNLIDANLVEVVE